MEEVTTPASASSPNSKQFTYAIQPPVIGEQDESAFATTPAHPVPKKTFQRKPVASPSPVETMLVDERPMASTITKLEDFSALQTPIVEDTAALPFSFGDAAFAFESFSTPVDKKATASEPTATSTAETNIVISPPSLEAWLCEKVPEYQRMNKDFNWVTIGQATVAPALRKQANPAQKQRHWYSTS
jgi:hypothetical protein